MASLPITKSFIDNDGGSRRITSGQLASSPTYLQLIPTMDGEVFELASAAPSSLDHQPFVVVVNGSSTYSMRLKIDGGLIHPVGQYLEIPPDRAALLLATQRSLQGTDWSLVNPAQVGVHPDTLKMKSRAEDSFLVLRTTDGKGRASIYWNTDGGANATYSRGEETAMKLTLHRGRLDFESAEGAGKAQGDSIAWQRELRVSDGKIFVRHRDLLAEIDDLKGRVSALESAA